VKSDRRRCRYGRRGTRGAFGREERKALEATRGKQTGRLAERSISEADEPLTVYPGEVVDPYGRAPASASAGIGAPADTPARAFESARR
jgi:hypothetical protein